MKQRPILLTVCLCLVSIILTPILHAAEDSPSFVIKNELLRSPASDSAGSTDFDLTVSNDGKLYIAWIAADAKHSALRFSQFDFSNHTWSPSLTVAEVAADSSDSTDTLRSPKIATSPKGTVAVLWQTGPRFLTSTSTDAGVTWSKPAALTSESKRQTSATLGPLADGRFIAAWTDLRNDDPALYSRVLGNEALDTCVDRHSNAPSPLAVVSFADGSALVSYRGNETGGQRDIRTARYRDGKWEPPSTLNADGWKPANPPAEGPVLDARGPHIAAAWFTIDDSARINVSTSSSAGAQWLMPNRVDDVAPLGRPSLVMLDDGSTLVAWVERDGTGESVFLRRLSARGSLSVPVRLAQNITGYPRIARVKDGDATPAQLLLVARETETTGAPARLVTRLITLPEAKLLAEADACDCDPRDESERGFGVKGRITAVDFDALSLKIAHDEIPGVMKAEITTFKAAPAVIAGAAVGNRVFARAERIGPDWWLFDLRTLVAP